HARRLPRDGIEGGRGIGSLTMNSLPAIPTPRAQRWRDFRLQGLPVLVFAIVAAVIFYMWNQNLGPSTFVGEVEAVQENVAIPRDPIKTASPDSRSPCATATP